MKQQKGHVLCDYIVINHWQSDRKDCINFVTHLNLTSNVRYLPTTATKIFTSLFNAWYLTSNNIICKDNVQAFEMDQTHKVEFKKKTFYFSLLDSKYSTGSVALLLHGEFGSYLYTGPFCFYRSFFDLPPLFPVIKNKSLKRIYLDTQLGGKKENSMMRLEENIRMITNIIRKAPRSCNIYFHIEKVAAYHILADIMANLEEKCFVEIADFRIMKYIGHDKYFTCVRQGKRIFLETRRNEKHLQLESSVKDETICFYLFWNPDQFDRFYYPCRYKPSNIYYFYFYPHLTNNEINFFVNMFNEEVAVIELKYLYSTDGGDDFSRSGYTVAADSCNFTRKGYEIWNEGKFQPVQKHLDSNKDIILIESPLDESDDEGPENKQSFIVEEITIDNYLDIKQEDESYKENLKISSQVLEELIYKIDSQISKEPGHSSPSITEIASTDTSVNVEFEPRKILRSEIKLKNPQSFSKVLPKTCSVVLEGMPKNYYYCVESGHYFPSFYGFVPGRMVSKRKAKLNNLLLKKVKEIEEESKRREEILKVILG